MTVKSFRLEVRDGRTYPIPIYLFMEIDTKRFFKPQPLL